MNELIRQATAADAETIAALHAANWRSAFRGILKDSTPGPTLDAERRNQWTDQAPVISFSSPKKKCCWFVSGFCL